VGYGEDRLNLPGKTAIVVGGGGGIGAAVTEALARAGAAVAFCDVDAAAVEETMQRLNALTSKVVGGVADALVERELQGFFSGLDTEFDRLDVLVNVVGGVRQGRFEDSSRQQRQADIHRNFGYVLESIAAALPRLRAASNGGSIVNFTTIEAHRGAAGFAVYAGAKAALTNFSRALAVELAPERIRVNLVAPDTTPSAGNQNAVPESTIAAMAGVDQDLMAEAFGSYVPMRLPPMPDDLADAVLFLASDMSRFITGTTLHVDGGTWAASGFQHWPEPFGWLPSVPASLLRNEAFK
jgi:NAD(P)-dependent dehydrogenase (short-subunit alcohol dehydrogenase family)